MTTNPFESPTDEAKPFAVPWGYVSAAALAILVIAFVATFIWVDLNYDAHPPSGIRTWFFP